MTALDRQLLAERAATLERHLERIATHLPVRPEDLAPGDACDVVILHLWQAVQLVIDLALSACSDLRLGGQAGRGARAAAGARRGPAPPHGSRLRLD